jgi:alcohol dehydrogenase (cytochrome c)
MVYIPANENHCGFLEGKVQEYVAGKWWTGVDIPGHRLRRRQEAGVSRVLQAWDVSGGKKVWDFKFNESMHWGSVLTTGGGLVFAGGTNDRKFRAHDAQSGKLLWEMGTNSGIIAPAIELRGRRQAVRRGGLGLGRGRPVPAGPDQQPDRLEEGSSGGRRDLGVWCPRLIVG